MDILVIIQLFESFLLSLGLLPFAFRPVALFGCKRSLLARGWILICCRQYI
jgi:hypothetical protein